MDAAADHAVGFGAAHTLPLLGLLQSAHAVRREGRGAPVSGLTQRRKGWAGGGAASLGNWGDVGKQLVSKSWIWPSDLTGGTLV